MLSATNCLDWICNTTNLDIGTALKLAEEFCSNDLTENNAPYFLPYLSGERTPHNSADIRAAFHQINTSTSKAAVIYSVLEGVAFGIKDGFEAVEAINKNTDETYIVGGGSKSDFWANLVGSAINKSIIIGEDSNLGPSLGAARLAMMATKNFASKDVFKKMPIRKETIVDEKLSEMLSKRYAVWSEIVSTNLKIAGKLKISNE
jgi:xylulokinase